MSDIGYAHALLQARQYARARDAARSLLAEAPDNAEAHLVVAQCALELDESDDAVRHASTAVSLEPENPDALRVLALALARSHRSKEARLVVETVLSIDPTACQTHLVAATVELDAPDGQLDVALRAAEEAVRLGPQEPATHQVLGLVLLRTHNRSSAEVEFRAALALDPQNADARWSLGAALSSGPRPGDAVDQFAQLAAEEPQQRAHSHNMLVALGNTLRLAYFAVVVPYLVIVRFLSNLITDGSTPVRLLLLASVALSLVTLAALGTRFIRRTRTPWRSLLRLVLMRDRLLAAWILAIGAILLAEIIAAAVPDEVLRFSVGLIAVPTLTSIVIWVVRLRHVSRRGRELSP